MYQPYLSKGNVKEMYNDSDVLGDEGRKALDACVKVKIYGRPENLRRYHRQTAVERLRECYAGMFPHRRRVEGGYSGVRTWVESFEHLLLPIELHEYGYPLNFETTYDITDIHEALANGDEMPYVEKYPKPGPGSDELTKEIEKRRGDVQREYQAAVADPDARLQYSWLVAQRRVRDCFAGNFAGDVGLLHNRRHPNEPYNIYEIHDAVVRYEEMSYVEKYPLGSGYCHENKRKYIDARRADIEREYEARYGRNKEQSTSGRQRRLDMVCLASSGELSLRTQLLRILLLCRPQKRNEGFKYFPPLSSFYPRRFNISGYQILSPEIPSVADSITEEFSQNAAEKRVMDCYAEDFPKGSHILPFKSNESEMPELTERFNIFDIGQTLKYFDEKKRIQKYPEDEGPGAYDLKKMIEVHSLGVKQEYQEAKCSLPRYSPAKAESIVRACFGRTARTLQDKGVIFPVKEDERGEVEFHQTYDIFDIHKMVLHFDQKEEQYGYSVNDILETESLEQANDTSDINAHRDSVRKEYQEAKRKLHGYSPGEAERRVRDCFAGCFLEDTVVFPFREDNGGIPKIYQTYDIFDVKKAVDQFDGKKLYDRYIDENNPGFKTQNLTVDQQRDKIEREYADATQKVEIEHGSGFIIHDHFIITNKHVIEDALCDKTKEICVSNEAIGELPCEVIHCDAGKDLALLYCKELNLTQNGICPMQLSSQPLLSGMQIFSLGYPMSHTDERALFVNGHVSGSKKTLSGHTMTVLNCALNSGSSGGPVLCWVNGQLKVVGVATQKHFKEILTFEEREKIEKIRESLQTRTISSVPDDAIKHASLDREHVYNPRPDPCQTPMFLLTLKLYDALETHSQFNLSNALPGHCVVEFIKEITRKYTGRGKEELFDVVKWSEDHVNVLPSGHHSASDCCVH